MTTRLATSIRMLSLFGDNSSDGRRPQTEVSAEHYPVDPCSDWRQWRARGTLLETPENPAVKEIRGEAS
jgi:hypothetical protein